MPLTVRQAVNAKPGRHGDGEGLYLLVKPSGARSWLLRVQADGVRRDVGLGSFIETAPAGADDVPLLQRKMLTLAHAREKARALRLKAHAGMDVIAERDRGRAKIYTFQQAAEAMHEARKDGWAPKTAASFLSSLKDHAFPRLGAVRVNDVEPEHIEAALLPIWTAKPLMATKVRHRIGMVLNFAKAKGWRAAEAPTRSLATLLPAQPKGGNMPAMPYQQVPAFITDLREKPETTGRLALLFLIASAARSKEVRLARWDQFDLDKRLWNRPADIMKGRVAHTVTLNAFALAVLEQVKPDKANPDALVFPSRTGSPISDMTVSKVMRDAKLSFVPHGFRSSFRDWAAELMPTIPDAVAEAALAHVVPDRVERAYRRTQFLAMRRELLDAWGLFIEGRANVAPLKVRA